MPAVQFEGVNQSEELEPDQLVFIVEITLILPLESVTGKEAKEASINSIAVGAEENETGVLLPPVPIILNLIAKITLLSATVTPVSVISSQENVIMPLAACVMPKFA